MERYIKEWLAIENIATKKWKQNYLVDAKKKVVDGCDNIEYLENNDDKYPDLDSKLPPCEERKNEKGEPCGEYYSQAKKKKMCVTKSRIRTFQEIGEILEGEDGLNYEVIDTEHIGVEEDDTGKADIFYITFLSKTTGDIVLLFPTGRTFKQKIDNEAYNFLTEHYKQIIKKIKTDWVKRLDSPDKKLIIGGHSMGASLSLLLGMMMMKEINPIFSNKCVITCSAPFRMLDKESAYAVGFENLPNVFAYAWCYPPDETDFISDEKTGKKVLDELVADCFLEKGTGNYNYEPIIYFTNPKKCTTDALDILKENGVAPIGILPISKKTDIGYLYGKECHQIHAWENYRPALNAMYPFEGVEQDFTSPTEKIYTKQRRVAPPALEPYIPMQTTEEQRPVEKTSPNKKVSPKSDKSSDSDNSKPKTRIGRFLRSLGFGKRKTKKKGSKERRTKKFW